VEYGSVEEKDASRIEFHIGGGSGGNELDKLALDEHGNVKRVCGESCDGSIVQGINQVVWSREC
jgi:hypothetical protein